MIIIWTFSFCNVKYLISFTDEVIPNRCFVTNSYYTVFFECYCFNNEIQVLLKLHEDSSGEIFANRSDCGTLLTVTVSDVGVYDVIAFSRKTINEIETFYIGNITIKIEGKKSGII